MDVDSKQVSWHWLTASALLCQKECELLFAYLVPTAGTDTVSLYDSENTTGKLIATLISAAVTGHKFKPPVPIYCLKGLYVSVSGSITGVLVMWRVL
jgi:hypothetical protein